jgi:hypothetical protein
MTQTLPLIAELADAPCSVAECLETACHLGRASVHVGPAIGVPPDFEIITLGLPLCRDHANLLRNGCTLEEFSSGL